MDKNPFSEFDRYDSILDKAKAYIDKQKPEASNFHRAAFANVVAYLATGISGGFGGPSVREHAAVWVYRAKTMTLSEIVIVLEHAQGVIFGPITKLHAQIYEDEYCFNDDPKDLEILQGEEELPDWSPDLN